MGKKANSFTVTDTFPDGGEVFGWLADGSDVNYSQDALIDAVSGTIPPQTALYLTGATSNQPSTPDHADLDITDNIDLLARVALDDWTPASVNVVLAKYNSSGSQRSYMLLVTTAGTLGLHISNDGSNNANAASTASVSATDGDWRWIRATYRSSDQRTQFFTSDQDVTDPDDVTWTQLGNDVTHSITGIHSGSALLEVGSLNSGGTFPMTGKVQRAQVKDGIGGTLVADFRADAPMAPRFRDSTGKVWTFNGSAWAWTLAA